MVEEGRAFEAKLKGALEELEGAEAAAHTQRSGRLEQFTNALAAASEAQHAGQRDEAVLEAVHRAAQVLKESTAQAHAALEEQRTLLGAAGEQQRTANASETIREKLSEARGLVDADTAARTGELAEQQKMLELQRGELAALAEKQEALRQQLLAETMSAMKALLDEKLGCLAAELSTGVQRVAARSEGVSTIASASVESHGASVATYGRVSEDLAQRTDAWGKACEQVDGIVGRAGEAAATVQQELLKGEARTAEEHTEAGSRVKAWASSDGECRAALAALEEQQKHALASEGERATAQSGSFERVRGLGGEMDRKSAAARESVAKASAHNEESDAQLQSTARKANDEAATQLADLGTLGAMQAKVIKEEGESLSALLENRPEAAEAMYEHMRKSRTLCDETTSALNEQRAAHATLSDGLLLAQRAQWKQLQEQSEAAATAVAATFRATKADVDAAKNRHAKQLDEAKTERETLSASHTTEVGSHLEKHGELLSGAKSAIRRFVDASDDATAIVVTERTQYSFAEQLKRCPNEESLRTHFMEHGDQLPFETESAEAMPASSSPA